MTANPARIGLPDRQQTGTGSRSGGATPRFHGGASVVSNLQRLRDVVPCLPQIASIAALLVGVGTTPVAAADEAALEKAAYELVVVERRLAGTLDSQARSVALREQARLERMARELAKEELRKPGEESRRENDDRFEGPQIRVFEGRQVIRERERRGGAERHRDSRDRNDDSARGRDPAKEADGDRVEEFDLDDDEHEEVEEDENENEEEEEEEEVPDDVDDEPDLERD